MQIVTKACESEDDPSHTEPLSSLSAGQQAANLALLTSAQSSS